MFRRRRLAVALLLAAAVAGAAPALARGAGPLHACGRPDFRCGEIEVPLDHSGATPGSISLFVAEQLPKGFSRGAVFLVQGGPGGASTALLPLPIWQRVFPGYTLVAYDDRGTGGSPLACPRTERDSGIWDAAAVQACGEEIGPSRVFYTTRDHAEDMESVRQALGLGRVGVYGVSYGTKQAVAYALAHPDALAWLVLDSVLPPEGPDPFAADVLRAVPKVLASICSGGGCDRVGRDPGADLVALANALAAAPVRVQHVGGFGTVLVNGDDLLGLLYDSDFNPLVAPELPAALAAGRAGWLQPLARLVALDRTAQQIGLGGIAVPLYLATTCGDGLFPWAPEAPVPERQGAIDAALAGLPPGSLGGFGDWAAASFGTVSACRSWPPPAGRTPLAAGPLPDVPVLVLAGDRDVRTPLAGSVEVASRFPRARVLVAPGVAHGVVGSSACVDEAVAGWLAGADVPAACPRLPLPAAPLGPFVRSLSALAPLAAAGLRGRTLAGVLATLEQAAADRLALPPPATAEFGFVTGLRGGWLRGDLIRSNTTGGIAYRLRAFSEIPGLTVSGSLSYRPSGSDSPIHLLTPRAGTLGADVAVAGPRAAHGRLHLRGDRVYGTLDGRRVSARLR